MGTIKASAKILFRNQKKDIWKQKKFLHKAPSKKLFSNGIHSFLRRADAKGTLTSFTVSDA